MPVPLASASRALVARWAGWCRVLVLGSGVLALIVGLWAGLARLGWALPRGEGFAHLHGPLLVSGLFGTLISLERAVALGRGWAYLAPLLAGAGTVGLLAEASVELGGILYLAASCGLTAATLAITIRQPALFTAALLAGAMTWAAGNLAWVLGASVPEAVGWWLAFLVLTIVGERLELSRLLARKRGSEALFVLAVAALLAGAGIGLARPLGSTLFGAALLLATVWLLRHDIARLNLRRAGQVRFMAACMMAGYLWLAAAGGLFLAGPGTLPFGYDMALHAVLIGFVLSMVFGHALIILPAVAGLRVRYSHALWGSLALLHVSVSLRLGGGLAELDSLRRMSGPLTLAALVLFASTLIWASVSVRSPGRREPVR